MNILGIWAHFSLNIESKTAFFCYFCRKVEKTLHLWTSKKPNS